MRWTMARALLAAWLAVTAPLCATVSAQTPPLQFAAIDVAPYAELRDGRPAGLYPRILARIAAESGLPIQVSVLPFARATQLLASGAIDGSLLFRNSTLESRAQPLVPLYVSKLVVQAAPGIKLKPGAELRKLNLGRMRGGCQDLESGAELVSRFHELDSHQQAIAMLAAGRLDGFCTASEALAFALHHYDQADSLDARAQLLVSQKEVWLLVRRDLGADVQHKLRAAVLRLRERGELQAMFREELGPRYQLHLPALK